MPKMLFGSDALTNVRSLILLSLGGFLVGFGARYAGGCTSGHAISGLSNFQLPHYCGHWILYWWPCC